MKDFDININLIVQTLVFTLISIALTAQQNPYKNIASTVGIDHTYIINNSGGGVSFVDFDLDGNDDITLATGIDDEIQFYKNNGSNFELVDLGIQNTEQVKSVLWVDIDNDGDKDFYATAFAGTNHLYENMGNLNFEQITAISGLPIDTLKSFGAIWGDYNRDGFLDLYYTERPNANSGTTQRNRLFKNNGNNTFEEVSNSVNAADEGRLPFCAAFFDYNNDKWPDIYIANDRKKRNTLLKNNKGIFEDLSEICQADIEIDAMNVGIADIDNNGLSDIYVTNTPDGSALLKCSVEEVTDQILFTNEASERGIGFYGIGWGANFFDADNDGWQDLYVCGMQIGSDVITNELFLNDQTGYFNKSSHGFAGDTVTSFVNAIGDFNNDGYPDIMVSNSEYFDSQLWSAEKGDNNWIKIDLQGIRSNRDGIGAKIEVFTGSLNQMQFTHCGIAFMGQNSNSHLFGLADNNTVDSIKITWPTGHIDFIENIDVNQKINVIEGQSTNGIIDIDEDITLITSTNAFEDQFTSVTITPNPARDYLQVPLVNLKKNYKYSIINSQGKSNSFGKLTDAKIDISELNPGLYFLKITDSNMNITSFQFVKI